MMERWQLHYPTVNPFRYKHSLEKLERVLLVQWKVKGCLRLGGVVTAQAKILAYRNYCSGNV
jgi:hypothetical protein